MLIHYIYPTYFISTLTELEIEFVGLKEGLSLTEAPCLRFMLSKHNGSYLQYRPTQDNQSLQDHPRQSPLPFWQ